MKLDTYLTPYIKSISEGYIRAKAMKFLEINIRINICDIELDNSFLHITSKVQRKIIKMKIFSKDIIKKVKRITYKIRESI